jgi:hypothetical protein
MSFQTLTLWDLSESNGASEILPLDFGGDGLSCVYVDASTSFLKLSDGTMTFELEV